MSIASDTLLNLMQMAKNDGNSDASPTKMSDRQTPTDNDTSIEIDPSTPPKSPSRLGYIGELKQLIAARKLAAFASSATVVDAVNAHDCESAAIDSQS